MTIYVVNEYEEELSKYYPFKLIGLDFCGCVIAFADRDDAKKWIKENEPEEHRRYKIEEVELR